MYSFSITPRIAPRFALSQSKHSGFRPVGLLPHVWYCSPLLSTPQIAPRFALNPQNIRIPPYRASSSCFGITLRLLCNTSDCSALRALSILKHSVPPCRASSSCLAGIRTSRFMSMNGLSLYPGITYFSKMPYILYRLRRYRLCLLFPMEHACTE